ncbi:60S ribosomal subunit assembly/export protein loc-1 [Apodospora peruviana]|uniref:60S ribosomal subunit assembly/export protein loc-1 n=1 Tax=Apodospora peruviana TaxID=516989 RepID=A0AAE0MAT2_9PEZI|nr:60S ribosomal subunit assembly/export protein loc-1 [Apodospora peruviana]
MAPSRTRTIKNKHAANGSGIKGSKQSRNDRNAIPDGVLKAKKDPSGKSRAPPPNVKGRPNIAEILKKRKRRVYTEKELGILELNKITPVGVAKSKGTKKGKVFVDDRESMNTILAIVQAEKEGQIESKMMKARQLEEIREARKAEEEKKAAERKERMDETKDSLRKKRKRPQGGSGKDDGDGDKINIRHIAITGSKAAKPKPAKKRVSFAPEE